MLKKKYTFCVGVTVKVLDSLTNQTISGATVLFKDVQFFAPADLGLIPINTIMVSNPTHTTQDHCKFSNEFKMT